MATGWPLVKNGLDRAYASYTAAKETPASETTARKMATAGLQAELKELGEEASRLRKEGASAEEVELVVERMLAVRQELDLVPSSRKAGPVLAAMMLREPMVLRNCALGIWSGVSVSVAAACNNAARSVGLGLSIGQAVAEAVASVVRRVDLTLHQISSGLPAAAASATYFGPSKVVSASVWFVGRTAGCWFAFKLQSLAMQFSTCLLSAKALLHGVSGLLKQLHHRIFGKAPKTTEKTRSLRQTLAWTIAAAGLYAQRHFKLPLPVKVLLLPAFGVEAILKGIAIKLTNDDFEKARIRGDEK